MEFANVLRRQRFALYGIITKLLDPVAAKLSSLLPPIGYQPVSCGVALLIRMYFDRDSLPQKCYTLNIYTLAKPSACQHLNHSTQMHSF